MMSVFKNPKIWKYEKPPFKVKSMKDFKRTRWIVAKSNLHFLLFLGFRSDLNRPLEKKLSSVANYRQKVMRHLGCTVMFGGIQ